MINIGSVFGLVPPGFSIFMLRQQSYVNSGLSGITSCMEWHMLWHRASNVQLWFLCCQPERTVAQTVNITMASWWAWWCLKSSAIRLFTQTFIQGADQRKHQSSMLLAFVRGIHQWQVNFPHKGPVTQKMFPFDDIISIGNPIVEIRWSYDRLISTMGFHILVRWDLYIESGPRWFETQWHTCDITVMPLLLLPSFW